jgi:hypothetical protein
VEPDLPEESYPADARAFARSAKSFSFSYRLGKEECAGFLYLSLRGLQEDAYMLLDGEEVDPDSMAMLDCDGEGTGHAAWYILDEDSAKIVWDVEETVQFSSLTEYLTEGAKRAFAYDPCWQTRRDEEPPLASSSLDLSTPLPEIRAALVARSAEPAMADDLVQWLGAHAAHGLSRHTGQLDRQSPARGRATLAADAGGDDGGLAGDLWPGRGGDRA